MSPHAARFGLLAFAVLTCAFATNIFVLQPPVRQVARLAPSAPATGAPDGWVSRGTPQAQSPSSVLVPPIETGAVRPLPDTADLTTLTRAVQRELKAQGYETGAVDGVAGLVTRGAIMAYENDAGLTLTAEPTPDLLQHLVLGTSQDRAARTRPPGPEAETVIRAVQRAFRQLGYMTTLPDGRLNDETRRAIRKFEADRKLRETGRISGELLAKLASLAGEALRTAQN